jgi:hypothetical protein
MDRPVPRDTWWERPWSLVVSGREALLAVRPLYVLGALVAVQWIGVLGLALVVRHNGWLYYQGGDQLWLYSSAYELAHGHLPYALVSYGWPALLAPLAFVAGPNLLSALPAVELVDVVVLLPIPLLCMYGIGRRVGGRLFGYWTAALWIAVPFLGIRYTLPGYHQKYTELNLPQNLGLGALADFPSVVVVTVAAYLCIRAIEDRRLRWGLACGLAVALAIALKPSNALFALAIAVALLGWSSLRQVGVAIAGLAPTLVTLAIWKERGLGHLPIVSSEPARRVALGAGAPSPASIPLHNYLNLDWGRFHDNVLQIQEHFWSLRLIEWVVIAGAIGILLRARPIGVMVVIWFASFVIVKGTFDNAAIEDGSLLRLLLPAAPAFVLLLASIPLLFPGFRKGRDSGPAPPLLPERAVKPVLAVTVAVVAVWPLALVAAASPDRSADRALVAPGRVLIPVEGPLRPVATATAHGVVLHWQDVKPGAADVFYRIYRSRGSAVDCNARGAGAAECMLNASSIGVTRSHTWIDHPPPGRWTYRVGVGANWLDDPRLGDLYLVSPPARVTAG